MRLPLTRRGAALLLGWLLGALFAWYFWQLYRAGFDFSQLVPQDLHPTP